jgi:DNA ligase (NAD+)
MIGDQVLVERAGDVIPYIVKALTEIRTGKETPIVFPTHCPVCGDPLFKPEEEAVWRCININCEAQVVERIIHYTSKDAMDLRGLGEANIRKFHQLGYLKDIPGIYHLPFEELGKMEGFGEKSITNLREAIEKSKLQPLHRLIYALGIRYVGETTAKTLANATSYLPDLKQLNLEELRSLEDVGVKVAESVYQFFHNDDNIHMLQRLEEAGVQLQNQKKQSQAEGILSGKTFLFTGTLNKLKRSEAEEMVEAKGGKLLSGVSSKLNYLVVGEDAGSKLEKAKKLGSVQILSEDDFLKIANS